MTPPGERLAPTRQIVPAITLDVWSAPDKPDAIALVIFACGRWQSGEYCTTQVQLKHALDADHPRHQTHVAAIRRAIDMGLA